MTATAMTEDEYRINMDFLAMSARSFLLIGGKVSDQQLADMLHTVEMADSIGCFADPTAYRTAMHDGRLARQRALIRAHQAFRAALGKQFTIPKFGE